MDLEIKNEYKNLYFSLTSLMNDGDQYNLKNFLYNSS